MKYLTLLVLIISNAAYTQCDYRKYSNSPMELNRKHLQENGMRNGNPYTMFVKDDNFNIGNVLFDVRKNIKAGEPTHLEEFKNDYAKLYKEIWETVKTVNGIQEPSKCPELEEDQSCMHPAWVKNNAVIYIVGLKYSVDLSGKGRWDGMTPFSRNLQALLLNKPDNYMNLFYL